MFSIAKGCLIKQNRAFLIAIDKQIKATSFASSFLNAMMIIPRECIYLWIIVWIFFFSPFVYKTKYVILAKTTIWIIPWQIAFFSSFFHVKRTCNLYWLKYYFCLRLEVNAAEIAKQFSSTFSTDSRCGSTWGIIFYSIQSYVFFLLRSELYLLSIFLSSSFESIIFRSFARSSVSSVLLN